MTVALVVLGHGSRNPAATAQFMDLVAQLCERRGKTVYPAFMELAEPSLPAAIGEAVAAGADEVVVQPCFLFDGNHVRHDVPKMLAELAAGRPGVAFRFGRPLGPDPRVVDVLLDRVAEATCLG